MATGIYIGASGIARKVKDIYIGVSNVARKVKYGFIGISNIARLFFSAESRITLTPLIVGRTELAAAIAGNYALFGGGLVSTDYTVNSNGGNFVITGTYVRSNVVDAYDTSLTRTTPTVLSVARSNLAATYINITNIPLCKIDGSMSTQQLKYAMFGGGDTYTSSNNYTRSNVVDVYSDSLTRTTPTVLSVARSDLAATIIGNYALFGGGYSGGYKNTVDAYNNSVTRSTPTALSVARSDLAATSVGNYALFGGGDDNNPSNVVDAYNSSLTRSTPTALSVARYYLSATSIGNYALFGGGKNSDNTLNVVDAYNSSLTRSTPTALNNSVYSLAATSTSKYAFFAGGYYSGSGPGSSYSRDTVNTYDTSLTRTIQTPLSVNKMDLAAISINDYALFAGGKDTNNTVDAYKL